MLFWCYNFHQKRPIKTLECTIKDQRDVVPLRRQTVDSVGVFFCVYPLRSQSSLFVKSWICCLLLTRHLMDVTWMKAARSSGWVCVKHKERPHGVWFTAPGHTREGQQQQQQPESQDTGGQLTGHTRADRVESTQSRCKIYIR